MNAEKVGKIYENSGRSIGSVRNIGILAHIDAGKTSLTERLLHVAGLRPKTGGVDEGTTATDYLDVEKERGITVKAASVNLKWKGSQIHLIDTPGHVDFGAEVDRSIRALDGAILAVCGVAGVQSRTEVLSRACTAAGLSRLIFINKLDRKGSDFYKVLDDIKCSVESGAVAIQMPWVQDELLTGVIDLIEMCAYEGSGDICDAYAHLAIPEYLLLEASRLRSILIERLADCDECIMENYLNGKRIPATRIRNALRTATVCRILVPVLCGTAFSSLSAALLLDAVEAFLPSPIEALTPEGTEPGKNELLRRTPDTSEYLSGFIFKTSTDRQNGRLSWSRIWSGSVKSGQKVLDSRSGMHIRVKRIFSIQANLLEEILLAEAGDIVALVLPETGTSGSAGATICDPAHPILYETVRIPEPVVSIVIEPRTLADTSKINFALVALTTEDAALHMSEDPQTGRYELSGLGELHLEIALDRIAREYGAHVRIGNPRVTYRETLTASVIFRQQFDRDIGGERIRTAVKAEIGPLSRGSGVVIGSDMGMRAPATLIEAAIRGLSAALSAGPIAGFPLDDVKATIKEIQLPSGSGRSAEIAVEAAASLCGRECADRARGFVLEPAMRIELEVPDKYFGTSAALIKVRGGRLETVENVSGGKLISAVAPMRLLFGFAREIRSVTEGRAIFQAHFYRFEPASDHIGGT